MCEIELVTRKWRRILRKLPDLTKSPSERYKLSVCIKGSCTTCIQPALYNFYGLYIAPTFVLRRLKKKKRTKKKKKMEKIAVFPFSVYNSSNVQFASVIGYIVTHTRYLKRL